VGIQGLAPNRALLSLGVRRTRKNAVIEIREEHPDDIAAIGVVNRRAFGRDQEGNIIDALRSNGAALLSLVATVHGRVVGHIMYSPLTVGEVMGAALGPMAVLPEYQRQGIGSQLVREGTQRLKETGCPFIVVVGHAHYYPRFGFTPARAHGITCEWDVPDDAFLVLVLDEAKTGRVSGTARYRTEFLTVE
jgi:putative acetyltransferase